MSSYIGRHAELYDIFYADKPYRKEAEFVAEMLERYSVSRTAGKNMLELACGTGSHALIFSEMGFDVTAVDYSAYMLECARNKAEGSSSNIRFIEGDMRQLDAIPEIAGQQFDVVVCLFDSIGYTLRNEDINKTLAGVHSVLKTGGIFCAEYWHAAAMLKNYSPVRVRRWQLPDREVIRISETTLDIYNQTAGISFDILELYPNGSFSRIRETQYNRYFLAREMENFFTYAGLKVISQHDGFNNNEIISDDTWHIVSFSRK